jgi:hypothetical protein
MRSTRAAKYKCLLVILAVLIQSCSGQKSPKQEIYNSDFKWTITIPENLESVSAQDWTKMQTKGTDAIEKTFDSKVVNQTTTIFVFKSDQLNYFESNYQPFDPAIDGDYLETCQAVNNILYETFMAQMPGIKIDTARSVENIDNLQFQKFKMKIVYPNKMVMNFLIYTRLFGKKEFSVNIMFVDSDKGKKMLDSWTNSKFGR